jgi:hypothetical protein
MLLAEEEFATALGGIRGDRQLGIAMFSGRQWFCCRQLRQLLLRHGRFEGRL